MAFLIRISLVVFLLISLIAAGALAYLHQWADAPMPLASDTIVELTEGETFAGFAAQLEREGIVSHAWMFTWLARIEDRTNRIQAGEYRISSGESPRQLLADLVKGAVAVYPVRIAEGETVEQTLARLRATPKLIDDIGDIGIDQLMPRLGFEATFAEGQFFPDTYDYSKGARVSDVLRRARQRMQKVLNAEWASRDDDLPYANPDEALILASIIEKETGRDEDRANISRVFVSRLARSMRLQTDPSVIYGLGDVFDGNLTRAHLKADNPYNTYKYRGLPPTPIALPSLASIHAALHPADSDYLYFVARGDGSSEFSATLEEHIAAVRRYQLKAGDATR